MISITQREARPLRWVFLIFLLALVLVDITSSSAFAAESNGTMSSHSSLFDWGSATAGSGGKGLNDELKSILITLEQAAKAISVIMTVVAGAMVCLNLQDGRKVIWNYILGIGLAINFGAFLFTMFGESTPITTSVTVTPIDNSQLEQMVHLKTNGDSDILSTFMAYFSSVLYANTDTVLKPIAFRLTLILATIDASVKLAMDLISGDKVKFMITTCLKVGFYLFLINEWLTIAPAVAVWFQNMGFMLGGMDPAQGGSLHADSIFDNAVTMVNTLVGAGDEESTGILDKASKWGHHAVNAFLNTITGAALLQIICMVITVIAIVLTAIEMLMARIEFYVMMAISTILLPFGVIDKLNFLAKGAISSVFNTGAKVMIIAFIQAIGTNLLDKYVTEYVHSQGSSIGPNFPVLLQILLFSLVLLLVTKKVPQLAQGFLNGQPALDGGSMKDLAMKTARSAGEAAKAVTTHGASLAGRAVGAGAKAHGDALMAGKSGKALAMSTLKGGAANFAKGLALEAMTKNPIASTIGGGFANGLKTAIGREGTMPYVDGKLLGEKTKDENAGLIASLLHRGKTSALSQYAARKAYDYQSGEDPFRMLGNYYATGKAGDSKDKENGSSRREPLTADQKEQEMNSMRRYSGMNKFSNGAYRAGSDADASSSADGTANRQDGASDSSKMSNASQHPSSSSNADSGAHVSSSADGTGSGVQGSASHSSQMSNAPQTPPSTSGADSGAHASSSAGGGSTPTAGQGASAGKSQMSNAPQTPPSTSGADFGAHASSSAGGGSTPAGGQGASAGKSKMSNTPQTPFGTSGADSGSKEK